MRANRRSVANSLSWLGEQAQTQYLDRNFENHQNSSRNSSRNSSPYPSSQKLTSYNSLDFDLKYTIRHQVIVWSVGIPDVKSHTVTMMFRVTLFWNDPPPPAPILLPPEINSPEQEFRQRSNSNASENNTNTNNGSVSDGSYWVMDGRRRAVRRRRTLRTSDCIYPHEPP